MNKKMGFSRDVPNLWNGICSGPCNSCSACTA
ncbi:hypothetical protein T12_14077 [Trichinella patagoniensis]|uniref:Uncharacterized protein n=1 Tax=Trichinella patagoniensis TaxID=990121 RepID=A0A0V0XJN9_9BILA|nr:hypothetical protein T12_14077 [Trichinella patagoniensis]